MTANSTRFRLSIRLASVSQLRWHCAGSLKGLFHFPFSERFHMLRSICKHSSSRETLQPAREKAQPPVSFASPLRYNTMSSLLCISWYIHKVCRLISTTAPDGYRAPVLLSRLRYLVWVDIFLFYKLPLFYRLSCVPSHSSSTL